MPGYYTPCEVLAPSGYVPSDINVTDNIFPDRDPETAKHFVVPPASSWYVVCLTTAPYGYDIPTTNPGCYPIATNVQFDFPANAGAFVDKPWAVAR
jgi:hypothetical protein